MLRQKYSERLRKMGMEVRVLAEADACKGTSEGLKAMLVWALAGKGSGNGLRYLDNRILLNIFANLPS